MKRAILPLALSLGGCASYWQASRLEEKVDQLLSNTRRETLSQIFGEQSLAITEKMETLGAEERTRLDALVSGYQQGNSSLEDVRSSVLGVLGGATRVVSGGQGIWVRNADGQKLKTLGRDAKIQGCQKVSESELPAAITSRRGLMSYSWGRGEVDGQPVLFPWELTMSSFAKEIVENTARRTAQEFLRMSGDKGWNRPVNIQVITESPGQSVTITHQPGEEIYVTPGEKKE